MRFTTRAAVAFLLLLSGAAVAEPRGSLPSFGPTVETVRLSFGQQSSGFASGDCLSAVPWAASDGGLCSSYTSTALPVNVVGIPRIVQMACTQFSNQSTQAAGETETFTPVWVQGTQGGAFNTTDADVTVVFTDGEGDQIGDWVQTLTDSSNSPYSGPQLMQIRMNVAGGDGISPLGAVDCQVVIEAPL